MFRDILPDELIFNILNLLPICDILNLSRTNSTIYNLCQDNFFWYKQVKYSFFVKNTYFTTYDPNIKYKEIYIRLYIISHEESILECIHEDFLDVLEDYIFYYFIENADDINEFCFDTYNILYYATKPTIIQMLIDAGVKADGADKVLFDSNNVEIIKILLQNELDINTCDEDGNSALFLNHHEEVLLFLIEEGINIHHLNYQFETPLFYARTIKIAQLLIDKGVNGQHLNYDCETPLFYVRNVEIAQFLICNGVDIHSVDISNRHALFQTRNYEIGKFLLDNKININQIDIHGNNMLIVACKYNNVNLIKLLIEYSIDINYVGCRGNNALYHCRNVESSKLLLDANINVNNLNINNENVLFSPRMRVDESMVALLLNYNVDVNCLNMQKQNILFHPDISTSVMRLVINKGCNIHQTDETGKTALFNASYETIQGLIRHNINVNHLDNNGDNALMHHDDISEVKLLIHNGINVNNINNAGKTILFKASSYRTPIMLKTIIPYISDINKIDNDGNNALFYCVSVLNVIILLDAGIDIFHKNNAKLNVLSSPHISNGVREVLLREGLKIS